MNNGLLQDEVAERLVDRLKDCKRTFPSALILGGAGSKVGGHPAGMMLLLVRTAISMLVIWSNAALKQRAETGMRGPLQRAGSAETGQWARWHRFHRLCRHLAG